MFTHLLCKCWRPDIFEGRGGASYTHSTHRRQDDLFIPGGDGRARSRLRFVTNQKKLLELASPLAADALDALADLSPSERAAVRPTSRGPPTELPPNMELLEFSAEERKAALDAGPLDWVEKGAVTAPTSQGRCATCAYFAGVAAVEGAWKLAGHPLVKLSEQEEIDW